MEVEGVFLISTGDQNSAIGKDGTFGEIPLGEPESRFTGRLEKRGKAAGTLRQRIRFGDGPVCDSGTVRWTGRKVAAK